MLRAERIGLFNDQILIYDTMTKFLPDNLFGRIMANFLI